MQDNFPWTIILSASFLTNTVNESLNLQDSRDECPKVSLKLLKVVGRPYLIAKG